MAARLRDEHKAETPDAKAESMDAHSEGSRLTPGERFDSSRFVSQLSLGVDRFRRGVMWQLLTAGCGLPHQVLNWTM